METHGVRVVRSWLAQSRMLLLWRWLLVKPGYTVTQRDYNHEGTHIMQMGELTVVGFYLWYGAEWFVKLLLTWSFGRAYRSVSLEQEAYGHQGDDGWCEKRPKWYWKRFVTKLSA